MAYGREACFDWRSTLLCFHVWFWFVFLPQCQSDYRKWLWSLLLLTKNGKPLGSSVSHYRLTTFFLLASQSMEWHFQRCPRLYWYPSWNHSWHCFDWNDFGIVWNGWNHLWTSWSFRWFELRSLGLYVSFFPHFFSFNCARSFTHFYLFFFIALDRLFFFNCSFIVSFHCIFHCSSSFALFQLLFSIVLFRLFISCALLCQWLFSWHRHFLRDQKIPQ